LRVLVLGAGSIGGYFGGRLAQAGHDVTFLVRAARKQSLDCTGLRIASPFGPYQAGVASITDATRAAPFEVVLVACKAYDLDSAIDAIRPAVHKGTAVLPLLNGLAHIERLNYEFGQERVLGGFAKIIVSTGPDNLVEHHSDWRYITFGEQDGDMSSRVLRLQQAFPAESVVAKAVPNIMQGMWDKMVHLCTVATMASLMRASVGEIAQARGGTDELVRLLELNADIAGRAGYRPTEQFLADYRLLFADKTSPYVPSMLRDIERGHPVESEQIVGYMLRKAREYGVDHRLHELAMLSLDAYEARRATGRH
jgi:2-dehydropantoate 2-reductase